MHQKPNLRMPSGTKILQLHRLSRCAMASHPLAQATRDWNAAHWYTCSIVRRVSIVSPWQSEHILAWNLGVKMAPPGLSSLLRGSLVWRGRWSTSMGYCAGMLAHLDPRLGMVSEYDTIETMSKDYVLIFLKNTGATTKWVAPTPPSTKWVAPTPPHLISECYYIFI